MKPKILVVDDEPDVVELLSFNLKAAGFDVLSAEDGPTALAKARLLPDVIVLDLMLPEMDGLEVCKILRQGQTTAAIPILILSAKTAEIDRVLGLEFGAEDYVSKPFSPREVVLRIKNLLKRRQKDAPEKERYEFGVLVLDVPRHLVSVMGRLVELTATEFKLLEVMMRREGRVQSRDQLLRDVWDYDVAITTRTVDTHVRRLREKLGPAARYVETVRAVGYRFAGAEAKNE